MDPSTVSVQGVPALFGGAGANVVGTSVTRAPADGSPEALEARRRRLAVVGVSLMGAAAVSTAVFQTVTGTSTTLAMTGGLGALLGSTATPTPQGPLVPLPAPAITDLGPLSSAPVAPSSPSSPSSQSVALRASQGPLAGPGELPDASRTAARPSGGSAGGGGGAPAVAPGGSSSGPSWGGSGTTRPGSTTPGSTTPGSTTPGGTTPGTTTPRSTSPSTTPPSSAPSTTPPPSSAPPKSETAPPSEAPAPSEGKPSEQKPAEEPSSDQAPAPSSGGDRSSGA